MAQLDDILRMLPIDQIASKLGVDDETAKKAVTEGGATILSGLQANAKTPDGAAAIEQALGRHGGEVGGGTVDLNAVDTADGRKILGHIFGGQEQQVAQKLTDEPRTAGIDFGTLLPMLAPIVMGFIANAQKGKATTDAAAPADGGGFDLGGMLGGLLRGSGTTAGGSGATAGGPGQAGGIDIGGLLGGLLGGGRK